MDELGRGQDHVAYVTEGDVVVRVASGPRAAESVAREARLLEFLAKLTEIPVPRPTSVDRAAGSLSYRRLPGVPLIEVAADVRKRAEQPVARVLGRLLKALHAVAPERVREFADRDDQPLDGWLGDAAGAYEAAASAITPAHRCAVERFLTAPPPPPSDQLVFSHNDLGIEHVLVDPASLEVTGIIDWSDAALCDPAYDYGLIFRDLGSAGLRAADPPPGLEERIVFYARCALLEDLAYGLATDSDQYVVKSLAGLDWVF